MINAKFIGKLIWEAVALPCIRFTIGYLPMILGSVAVVKLSTIYWLTFMIEKNLAEWLDWYIPAILVLTLAFGVLAQNARKIHPAGLVLMLISSLIIMQLGVTGMQFSLYLNEIPKLLDSVLASIFAVISIYSTAMMIQRAWMGFLPKRRKR